MKDTLENINRFSSRDKNINKSFDEIENIIRKSYFISEEGNHSVPSAGGLYGLEITLFSKNYSTFFNKNYMVKESFSNFEVLEDMFRNKDVNFSTNSFFIAICYNYQLYFQKYGNCGVRYAAIECGAFLQNLQLSLSKVEVAGCPIGSLDDKKLNLEEVLLYFLIN